MITEQQCLENHPHLTTPTHISWLAEIVNFYEDKIVHKYRVFIYLFLCKFVSIRRCCMKFGTCVFLR